ncbi:phage major capsid protein [Demequina rhizosphaerae]|uniref:phage major capsid protein n=1 Tax=Demequina rhizosphaerae TaxID=1638985 RepID=UPI00078229CA|nr:phage major capsid protein [Demequina rhizosphaerae]
MAIDTTAPKGLYPDQTFIARDVVPDALIYELTTVAGAIEGDTPQIRVPYVSADPTTAFVAEGADITASDPTLDEVLVSSNKIAVLTKVSNESNRYDTAAELIADSMARAVMVKANGALLTSAASPTGLLSTSGIVDGGTLGTDLDIIVDAITSIEANGGEASHITIDPASWGLINKIKAGTDSNTPLIGAPADQTERRLFGLPVVVTASMTAGNILVSDKREIVSAVGPLYLAASPDVYFASDSVARRVTWRIGWNVVRPNRLAKIAVTLS